MSAHALIDSLHGIRRRVKAFAVTYGMALVVALAIGILLAILLVDYELSLDPAGRLMLMLIGLGSWGYAAWHWVVRPAMAKITIGHIAGSLEQSYPQFDDRLRSTIDFVGHDVPGSKTMKDRVVNQATELARGVDLDQVIVGRPVYLSVAGAVAAMAVLIVLTAIAGHEGVLGTALDRLALGNKPWPKSVAIALVSDLPPTVTAGQHIDVAARLAKGDRQSRKAVFEFRYGSTGPWQQLVMARGPDGVYCAAIDARLGQDEKSATIQTRITAGDDALENTIGVVPKLEISAALAGITPPAYVQPRSQSSVDLAQRPALAVAGSDISLRFRFNKALAAGMPVELRPVKDAGAPDSSKPALLPKVTWDVDPAAGMAVAHFQAGGSFRFTVHATDADKFTNLGSEEYQIVVREDQMPTVQIDEPRHSDEYVANARFPIHAVADDDFGIPAVRMVITRIGVQQGAVPTGSGNNAWIIDLVKDGRAVAGNSNWAQADSTTDRKRYALGYDWDLSALPNADLKPGDVLEYYLEVKDNFSLNGKEHDWVSSGKLRATIISVSELKQKALAQLQSLAGAIESTRKDQDRNTLSTQLLQESIKQSGKFDQASQAQADRLASKQSDLAVQTQQIAEKLNDLDKWIEQNQLAESDPLRQAARNGSAALQNVVDSPMHQAKESLNGAKDAPPADPKTTPQQQSQDAGQRNAKLAQATQHQQQASEELANAQRMLGDFSDAEALEKQAEKLAHEQAALNTAYGDKLKNALGLAAGQMTPKQRQDAGELAKQQDELRQQTQSLIQSLADKGSQENSKSDPASQQAMQDAAQAGRQAGITGQQGESSDSMQQNHQRDARDAQQQAELGLQQMVDKLRTIDAAKLAKLIEKLKRIQDLLADLAARQAGHNMDNLLIQGGPGRLARETAQVRQQLFDLSGRKPQSVASINPQLGTLTGSQEQTEHNARSLLNDTDELKDLKDLIASIKIEAAADQMELAAAVELQNEKLADAYDPPQVQALKDLLDARETIDKAAADARQKQDDQKKESIRERYAKLLEDQKDLDARTRAIDALPKDEDGSLSRAAVAEAQHLPAKQQDLADRAGKIGDDLKNLGSIVYDWANDDVIHSMQDVKTDLTKPDTGQPTQIEQRRIEDQLLAMIDGLNEPPQPKPPFVPRNNDTGGGSGSASASKPTPIPSEVELRLLKRLQQGINDNTVALDNLPTPNNQRLADLGAREGDIRGLFDKMIQSASQGKFKLNPPPADNLARNATDEDITDQELQQNLLGDHPDEDAVMQGIMITGDRMARVNNRLGNDKDPGQVTQNIEKRIVLGLDALTKFVMNQKPGPSNAPPKPGDAPPDQPKPGDGTGGTQTASNGPAGKMQESQSPSGGAKTGGLNPGGPPQIDATKFTQDNPDRWGDLSPREQRARLEAAGEKEIERYKTQIDEYTKTVSEQESKQQP